MYGIEHLVLDGPTTDSNEYFNYWPLSDYKSENI